MACISKLHFCKPLCKHNANSIFWTLSYIYNETLFRKTLTAKIFSNRSIRDFNRVLSKTMTLRKKFSHSVFRVFLVRIFPHSDWIRRDKKYGHFSHSVKLYRLKLREKLSKKEKCQLNFLQESKCSFGGNQTNFSV